MYPPDDPTRLCRPKAGQSLVYSKFSISLGTALHLVVITEASGVGGVALALAHILARDLATRVGNQLFFVLDGFGYFGRYYYGEPVKTSSQSLEVLRACINSQCRDNLGDKASVLAVASQQGSSPHPNQVNSNATKLFPRLSYVDLAEVIACKPDFVKALDGRKSNREVGDK